MASIFPKAGKAKRGMNLDGWQVELFAVDLPADAWPAPEAVCAYFSRAGQENRFAQDDRELGLDRIASYHLPGQELATLVGLSLWNLRLVRGFELDRPPAERPTPRLRQVRVDDRVPVGWPRDPVVRELLAELDWKLLLAKHPGWVWDVTMGELRCADGRAMGLTSVRPAEHARGRTGIILRRPTGGCEDCAPRQGCLQSERDRAVKHVDLSVPTRIAEKLRARLATIRRRRRAPAITPVDPAPGPQAVTDSLFLPAEARATFREAFRGASVRIERRLPPPDPPGPRLVAVDVAERQRRRKTWAQNLARYALPEGATVRIALSGSATLGRLLGRGFQPKADVETSA